VVATTLHAEPLTSASLLAELDDVLCAVQRLVRAASPGCASGDQAVAVAVAVVAVERLSQIQRAVSSGVALYAPAAAAQAAFSPRLTEAIHLGLIGQGASHKELTDAAAHGGPPPTPAMCFKNDSSIDVAF
jgi:hypothetical protein